MEKELAYRCVNINQHYGELSVLKEINFNLAFGDRLGIVGESGAGKSTLIKILCGLAKPTSGEVYFAGKDIVPLANKELGFLRKSVQLIFQDPRSSLNPSWKIKDIIAEPLRAKMVGFSGNLTERVEEVLAEVELSGLGNRYPHELSGGQRQRAAIARALAPHPKVLIADEPVSALDVIVRNQIMELLEKLVASENLTLIFLSHDLAMVRQLCHKTLVLRHGEIIEFGENVLADPQSEYTKSLIAAIPKLKI